MGAHASNTSNLVHRILRQDNGILGKAWDAECDNFALKIKRRQCWAETGIEAGDR